MKRSEKTRTWWLELLANQTRLHSWLVRLYNNERDACGRFQDFAARYCKDDLEAYHLFSFIAEQERKHGLIVLNVLIERKIVEREKPAGLAERYWQNVLPCVKDKASAAGVGALAEQLSLERMRVIINCDETPDDLREMFRQIEPDESLHAKALANLAGKHGISSVIDCHSAGLEALGLKLQDDATRTARHS